MRKIMSNVKVMLVLSFAAGICFGVTICGELAALKSPPLCITQELK